VGSELNNDLDNELDNVLENNQTPGASRAGSSERQPDPAGVSPGSGELAGQQVGRYRIERLIGSGGVATVYQAYDQVQGIPVALKVLPPHADAKTSRRFRREALTAGGLRHEHIVRVLQVGPLAQGGIAYMAMDLVDGESLSSLLNSRGALHPHESCNLLEPIARALDHAHPPGLSIAMSSPAIFCCVRSVRVRRIAYNWNHWTIR
jgi:serine/threonine protein kinase